MGLVVWIIFGLIVGMAARFLRFATTIALGVVGALLGALLGRMFGWYQQGDPVRFALALVGAIALLMLFRVAVRPPSRAA
jgi:uncharacterized membrane protein YeaQ/YmgE (transglycosylase-associated protein family)